MKEVMSLSNLGTVALHAAKVPTNMFSSTLICILTLDYDGMLKFHYFVNRENIFLTLFDAYQFFTWVFNQNGSVPGTK